MMTRTVAETIACAREWVELHGRHLPGVRAAHIMGALTSLPSEAPFPSYRDVDIALVTDEGTQPVERNLDVAYRGLIIECGLLGVDEYRDPELLLANPGIGPHLLADSVLWDPGGLLAAVQPAVRRGWRRRRWIRARCEVEKRDVLRELALLEDYVSLDACLTGLYRLIISLAGLLAVGTLRTPTHRRCLVVAREVLGAVGRPDVHEALLGLLGHAALRREDVVAWLAPISAAFDRAVAVRRSPSPFGFKLHPHVRPIFIEGAQELVDEGHHREAMWWLAFAYYIANAAIQNDGDEVEKPGYQAMMVRVTEPLMAEGVAEWQVRTLRARRTADEIFALVDELAMRNADMLD